MRRASTLSLVGAAACIIPDREIVIDPGLDNPNAVRIIQRAPQLLPEMDDLCNPEVTPEGDTDDPELSFCPEVRDTLPSGLIRPFFGDAFCICPGPQDQAVRDSRAISTFEIYAEDGDVQGNAAKDTIYGVILLDVDPSTSAPQNFVAYENYWDPCRAGEHISVSEGREGDLTAPPVGRESNQVTVFKLDDSGDKRLIDLCNNDQGRSLPAGLHDLQFMVTDRPFFTPPEIVDDVPFVGSDGEVRPGNQQCGVPDLAAGATYAVIDYVFECVDSALDAPDCMQPERPGQRAEDGECSSDADCIDAARPFCDVTVGECKPTSICRCDCLAPQGGQ
jgi:hypothetical protein